MSTTPDLLSSPPLIQRLKHYVSLLKVRPMSAVIYSAVIGYLAAPSSPGWIVGLIAILCIATGGGGSAALNMWYETDVDARMARTRRRVLVAGQLKARRALIFGAALCIVSPIVMLAAAGPAAALMLIATMGAYFGLYTVVLKRWTPHSVTIGGALAGILTPLTGWVAATGRLDATALILFGFVFFWTPPHVWSQAMYRMRDYAQAGIPMLPAEIGQRPATRWILGYTVLHSILALAPVAAGLAGWLYGATAIAFGLVLTGGALNMARAPGDAAAESRARPFFRLSIAYLMTLLTVLAIDRAVFL